MDDPAGMGTPPAMVHGLALYLQSAPTDLGHGPWVMGQGWWLVGGPWAMAHGPWLMGWACAYVLYCRGWAHGLALCLCTVG